MAAATIAASSGAPYRVYPGSHGGVTISRHGRGKTNTITFSTRDDALAVFDQLCAALISSNAE